MEDNPGDAGLVREALAEHSVSCEVLLVTDGATAIELIDALDNGKGRCPDLVILDLNLPRRPGKDVLERMRASVKCGRVPVVVLTSSDRQEDRDDAARLGASRYIRKPSRLAEFLRLGEVFKEILANRGQA